MSPTSPRPETRLQRDVIERIRRFARLRAAERALHPSTLRRSELRREGASEDLARELRALLEEARAEDGASTGGCVELAAIDVRLDELADGLRALAEGTPLAQLRATLPWIARHRADETIALLDLCLEHRDGHTRPLPLVDYLITLLCTSDEGDGPGRVLSGDPVDVSPGVARRCRSRSGIVDDESYDLEEAFLAAAARAESAEDLGPLVRDARALKEKLGDRLFVPDVLRSVVRYNIAVANRTTALLERERAADAAWDRETDAEPGSA